MRNSLYLAMAIFFIACQKVEIQEGLQDIVIVESYISPGDSVKLNVSKQLSYLEDNSNLHIDSLTIELSNGVSNVVLTNISDGKYYTDQLAIEASQNISFSFIYNETKVSAYSIIPTKPQDFKLSVSSFEAFDRDDFDPSTGFDPPDPVEITFLNTDLDYHMIVVENIEDDPELINEDTDRPVRNFRNAPFQGDETQINPMTFSYYGIHRVILYRLNPEYAALYEQLESSSLDITTPPSNVENGLGIFTGMNSDTLFLNVY